MAKLIVKHRRGTTEQWLKSLIIPEKGEIVIEDCGDVRRIKIGDGTNLFKDLPYPDDNLQQQIIELSNQINELPSTISSVDGLTYENNFLQLTANGEPVGEPVEIVGGGGGSVSNIVTKIKNDNGTASISTAKDSPVVLKFTFTSTEDGESTGNCTCKVIVDEVLRLTKSIEQGSNEIDVSEYLRTGTNTVKITCSDSFGNARSLVYTITVIELRLTSSFDSSIVYEGDITFRYVANGLIDKVVHFIMDGDEIAAVTVTDSGTQDTITLPEQPHGVHLLEVYITAALNETQVESNHLLYDVMCVDAGNREALISSVYTTTNLIQGDLVSIPYSVYDPNSLTADIELVIYQNQHGELVEYSKQELTVSRGQQYWNTRNYPVGRAVFKIIYNYTRNEQTGGWINQVSKTFAFNVSEPDIKVEAETSSLELYLSSQGRSNSERDPGTWTYNNITTTFTNFNWSSNGWIIDENGDPCLRLNGDATAEINIKPFENDFKPTGKTIEFEFAIRDVNRQDAVVIDCMSGGIGLRATADTAYLNSLANEVSCRYKDNERIRVGFSVEAQDAGTRFVSIYLDGILSGIVQYETTDNFEQFNPTTIKLGSPYCGLDLYTVRIYNTGLDAIQMRDNYIADMSNTAIKIDLYNDNNIYNEFGKLSYSKLKTKLPTITFIGSMPTYKGDKKKDEDGNGVRMIFEHPTHPELNFDEMLKQIDVQGTSSQYYVRKNWKLKTKKAKQHIPGAIPEKTFCIKVDYAEATGTHNTQNANIVETLYSRKILPQQEITINDVTYGDPRVRTTIQGYPCVLFQLDIEDQNEIKSLTKEEIALRDDLYFSSKGNFNYDKDALEVFGFTNTYGDVECWEFCNNTEAPVTFLGEININNYDDDFEARYHPRLEELEDMEDNKDTAGAAALKVEMIQRFKEMHDWVRSTDTTKVTNEVLTEPYIDLSNIVHTIDNETYRLAKFQTEFESWFNMHYTAIYYVYTFFAIMMDQRAKNLFLTYWPDELGGSTGHWYPYFYDNDTCFGINNEGQLVFDYYHEDTDIVNGAPVYNGQSSVLWNNFRRCFPGVIRDTYAQLRDNNKLTEDKLVNQFITEGSDMWSASVYNEDAEYKYVSLARPEYVGESKGSEYLYQVRGDGKHHFKYFVKNRLDYCDSKWYAGSYPTNTISMRVYSPELPEVGSADYDKIAATLAAVPPKADVTLTPYQDMYLAIKYGAQNITWESLDLYRAKANETVVLTAPEGSDYNDTETAIFGASALSSLGDLSALYCGSLNVAAAKKLINLQVGNQKEGYCNLNLKTLSVGENTLLKTIDISNCPNLTGALGLSKCSNIEEIYAEGSGITSISLPPAGYLRVAKLPNTITSLVLQNQPYIEDLSVQDYTTITQLCIDNCPTLDTVSILNQCKDTEGNWTVERVRLTNLNWELDDVSFLKTLFPLKGLDTNGANADDAYLIGTCHIKKLTGAEMAEIKAHYPYLDITYDEVTATLTFMDTMGENIIDTQTITSYNSQGQSATDPTTRSENPVAKPAKDSTAQYHFNFNGWTRVLNGSAEVDALWNVVEDRTLYPAFENILRSYPVKFYNEGRTAPLYEIDTYYGYTAEYPYWKTDEDGNKLYPNNPDGTKLEKLGTEAVDNYDFQGWNPSPAEITGPTNCYAVFQFDGNYTQLQPTIDFEYNLEIADNTMEITKSVSPAYLVEVLEQYTIEGVSYTVDTIGGFENNKIELIKLPQSIIKISNEAFENNDNLLEITIDENVEQLGMLAFADCNKLQTINYNAINASINFELSEGETSKSSYAPFYNSWNSKGMTVNIGEQVTSVPDYIFSQSSGKANKNNKLVFSNSSKCHTIGSYAFNNADLNEELLLPNSLININDHAFLNGGGVKNLIIPNSVEFIGTEAFAQLSDLQTIFIPASVTTMKEYPFHSCPKLETISVDVNNATFEAVDNCLIQKDNNRMILGNKNSIIPANVTSFDSRCFAESDIISVAIPAGVTQLSSFLFSGCRELQNVSINANVEQISSSCFSGCRKLNPVNLSYVKRIQSYAFSENYMLTNVDLPIGLTSLGLQAFNNCINLESITFNSGLATINGDLFNGCISLTTINIPLTEEEARTRYGDAAINSKFGAPNPEVIINFIGVEET